MLSVFAPPAAAAGVSGISTAAPWDDPALLAEAEASRHPLETRFWERVDEDAAAVELWREGLLDSLRFARSRPQVFPRPAQRGRLQAPLDRSSGEQPRPAATGSLAFEENRQLARRTWVRAMDYWLALDWTTARYGEFEVLADTAQSRAAFLVAYSAYLAQARFALEWPQIAGNDPALTDLFNEPIGELGVPTSGYLRIRGRFAGPGAVRALRALRAHFGAIGGASALAARPGPVGPPSGPAGPVEWRTAASGARPAWAARREADSGALGRVAGGAMTRAQALTTLRGGVLRGVFPLKSAAARPRFQEARAQERAALLPAPPEADVSISSRVVYALDTLRHWFRIEPSTAARAEALITREQILIARQSLRPGDILLARREGFLTDIGQPGYWHHAGIFIGTKRERAKFFRRGGIEERLKISDEAAYSRNSVVESTAAAAPTVLSAGPDGVELISLERFAAADSLAALRPKLPIERKAEALLRGFGCLGKPYDFMFNFGSDASLSSAELVYRAYAAGLPSNPAAPGGWRTTAPSAAPSGNLIAEAAQYGGSADLDAAPDKTGLRLPLEETLGLWTLPVNALARVFDAEFGTVEQQFDWVLSLDGNGSEREARSSTLEEFRRSWRRPKWALKEESKR